MDSSFREQHFSFPLILYLGGEVGESSEEVPSASEAGEQALEVGHCVCPAYAMEGGLIRPRPPPHLAPTSAPLEPAGAAGPAPAAGEPLALQRLQRVVS